MRNTTLRRLVCTASLLLAPAACVEEVTLPPNPPAGALGVGDSRTVELRFLRFDVKDFKKILTLEDLRAMPQRLLEETWLLDLPMTPFVENALTSVTFMPPEEAYAMPLPAQNLWRLLNMTPESADLSGTQLESLLDVGMAVGLPPSRILSDLVQIGENDLLVPTSVTAQAVMQNVVSTHPSTQTRRGPITSEHPDGLYPVAPNSLPVSLADVVSNFAGLAERFGPAGDHPGFILEASPIVAAEENFKMTVKVSLNALPYKGVDATNASVASVSSVASQIDTLFDFSDPNWLTLEGLSEDLQIDELTMAIYEDPAFIPGGTSRDPLPTGNSPVWDTPPWEFEHLLATAGMIETADIDAHCSAYGPEGSGGSSFTAVDVCIDGTGWTQITVDPSVELENDPPPPSYFWDILLEVAQVRLHDGGLAEGDANIELTVHDVPVGVSNEELVSQIRANIQGDPRSMLGFAEELTESTKGDADFYYYQPSAGGVPAADGDYLYFIAPEDLRKDEEAEPVRAYDYEHPGFFADADLTEKISTMDEVDGDVTHEKVRIEPGMTLYMEDNAGQRFAIAVGEKPSRHRIALTLRRIQ